MPNWELPRVDDLVMIRRHALDNVKRKKMEPRWVGPVRVLRFSASGWVGILHGAVKGRRYHVDDVKVYVRRDSGQ